MKNQITKGEWKTSSAQESKGYIFRDRTFIARTIAWKDDLIKEKVSREEAETNAEAICNAVNFTYGKGINPEGVPDLLKLLKDCHFILLSDYEKLTSTMPRFANLGNFLTRIESAIVAADLFLKTQSAIEKATIK